MSSSGEWLAGSFIIYLWNDWENRKFSLGVGCLSLAAWISPLDMIVLAWYPAAAAAPTPLPSG